MRPADIQNFRFIVERLSDARLIAQKELR